MDCYLDEFEEKCEPLSVINADAVSDFLLSLPSDSSADVHLVTAVAQTALELSWIRWPAWLNANVEKEPAARILEQFRSVPRHEDFRDLLPHFSEARQLMNSLAESEYRLRMVYGDFIHVDCLVQQGCTLTEPEKVNQPRSVTSDIHNNFVGSTALHGRVLFGRQRSRDPENLKFESTTYGRRILLAPRSELRISREQMSLQLLSPDYGILQNVSTINKVLLEPGHILRPGEQKLVEFPFNVKLPTQRLHFE